MAVEIQSQLRVSSSRHLTRLNGSAMVPLQESARLKVLSLPDFPCARRRAISAKAQRYGRQTPRTRISKGRCWPDRQSRGEKNRDRLNASLASPPAPGCRFLFLAARDDPPNDDVSTSFCT